MGDTTAIEWADYTFNPWMGCTKVSPACANCYAERDMDKWLGKVQWGPNGTRVKTSAENWGKPIKWDKQARGGIPVFTKPTGEMVTMPVRPRVFCASLADVFEDWQGPIVNSKGGRLMINDGQGANGAIYSFDDGHPEDDWGCRELTMDDLRRDLFSLIDATPNLDWLLLTKRPENVRRMWPQRFDKGAANFPDRVDKHPDYRHNVWIGTSVENQEQADKRIPELLKCRDLSPALFLSMEPLLGPVDLSHFFPPTAKADCPAELLPHYNTLYPIDWIIAGGESGPSARPMHPDWARSLRDQCEAASVPFFFKQWGEWVETDDRTGGIEAIGVRNDTRHEWVQYSPEHAKRLVDHRMARVARVGKKAAGRLLDGREWNGFPVAI